MHNTMRFIAVFMRRRMPQIEGMSFILGCLLFTVVLGRFDRKIDWSAS